MGTRGFVGFVSGGLTAITYNHFDSYPSGIGVDVLAWLVGLDAEGLNTAKAQAANLRIISDEVPPSVEDMNRLSAYNDDRVTGNPAVQPNWYQLLRKTQGNPGAILDAGLYEDSFEFPFDSLFCEWGYLIDFDSEVFEVYEGFQKQPHDKGRFAAMRPYAQTSDMGAGFYYPVRLKASWPLSALPTEEAFLTATESREDGYMHWG